MIHRFRNNRGSSSVEFIAILPFFILLGLVVWQFAVIGYAILNTQAAARDGIRVASTVWQTDPARQAAKKSFGQSTSYYSLTKVDVEIDKVNSEATLTVHSSIYPVLIPKAFRSSDVAVPFQWKVTAPLYQ